MEEVLNSAQFGILVCFGVIWKGSCFTSGPKGSPLRCSRLAGDPSLRLKNGSAQNDATRRRGLQ
jgi:hypothetical protein